MGKNFRRAILNRSRLKRVAYKAKSPNDIAEYKKQRNIVVRLNRAAKNIYYDNLDPNDVGFKRL